MFWLVKEVYMRIVINKWIGELSNTTVLEIKNVFMFCYNNNLLQYWIADTSKRFEREIGPKEWFQAFEK